MKLRNVCIEQFPLMHTVDGPREAFPETSAEGHKKQDVLSEALK
jgi:hypothetical protein